jgi:excinuclease ABC subunit B
MYADKVTGSMKRAINETQRRRKIQEKYNQEHNITPKTIRSPIKEQLKRGEKKKKKGIRQEKYEQIMEIYPSLKPKEKTEAKQTLKVQMEIFADSLEFEKAAEIRDFLKQIE